ARTELLVSTDCDATDRHDKTLPVTKIGIIEQNAGVGRSFLQALQILWRHIELRCQSGPMREHGFDKIPCRGPNRSTPLNQPALAANVCQSGSTEPGRQCWAAGQAKGAGLRRLGSTRQTKARHETGVHGKKLRKRVVEILDG